ncbi:MAG: dienelactone hydrolase family protein [Anaerolineales bacterium]
MSEVVLFHHVLGLTPGVIEFADKLGEAGHTVHTPDSFDGRTFSTLEEGLAYAREIGFGELTDRATAAASELPKEVVYAGFSLGVVPAQKLAQTRAGVQGALFFHSCLPVSEFGSTWPQEVPVQIHAMEGDPFFVEDGDIEAARALLEQAGQGEMFLYPGNEHLFSDSSIPSYDAEATSLLLDRVMDFLADL